MCPAHGTSGCPARALYPQTDVVSFPEPDSPDLLGGQGRGFQIDTGERHVTNCEICKQFFFLALG